MAIPPGVSSADWTRALGEFSNIVGKDWVFTSDEDIALYKDAYTPFRGEPDKELVASAAVAPQTVEQVQAVVKTANTYNVPIYAFSTGRNLGYGGTSPAYSGSVAIDLKRMNKIVDVNEELGTCIVEPGVSYFEMYRYLTDRGIKLLIDPPQPGWGSVMGNALDHGVGESPRRDHFDSHCGMEVVLPDGEIVRTGIAAVPAVKSWYFKYGFGPHVSPIFSQSNFGIVTKIGMHLMRMPEVARIVQVSFRRYEALQDIIDSLHHLYDSGALTTNLALNSPLMGNRIDEEIKALFNRFGETTAAQWNAMGEKKNLAMFSTPLRFFGPEKIVAAHVDYCKEKLGAIGGVFTEDRQYRYPLKEMEVLPPDRYVLGIPTLQTFTQLTNSVNNGHFFFAPAIPMTAKDLINANIVFSRVAYEEGVYNGFSGGVCFFNKTFIFTYSFYVDQDVEGNRKKRRLMEKLVAVGAKEGYVEYRTGTAFQGKVMSTFDWNDNALLRMHERIKDALDPNGIYAAGKSGIWPKRLRDQKKA